MSHFVDILNNYDLAQCTVSATNNNISMWKDRYLLGGQLSQTEYEKHHPTCNNIQTVGSLKMKNVTFLLLYINSANVFSDQNSHQYKAGMFLFHTLAEEC